MTFNGTIVNALSALTNLAPYHMLIYGTLLGTELYQVLTFSFPTPQKPLLAKPPN